MKGSISEPAFTTTPLSKLLPANLVQYVVPYLEKYQEEKNLENVFSHQIDTFGHDQEFGLLNRLDNDTAGFLYFARTQETYDKYKTLQRE
jgi:23S rRNA-/tRNA-specific pseudouridylate synthase